MLHQLAEGWSECRIFFTCDFKSKKIISNLKKIIKKTILTISVSAIVYLIINIATPYIGFLKTRSIENQITYLDEIFSDGYDDELQLRYPEGKIFSNALLALSIIDYSDKNTLSLKKHALIVDRCIMRLLSESAEYPFVASMKPEFGAFFNGWLNFTLNKYANSNLFKLSTKKSNVLAAHERISDEIISTQSDSIKILDTYPGSYWPADNLVGILSIEDEYIKAKWLGKLYEACTSESKLLHHSGYNTNEVRGSSQALILYLLSQYNIEKSSRENLLFQNLLVENVLGIELVKEFTADVESYPDVDSGPVILGYGAVATVMNIKSQAALDNSSSKCTWAFLNSISIPVNFCGQKHYLFKKEPMYDVFMLWCSVEL